MVDEATDDKERILALEKEVEKLKKVNVAQEEEFRSQVAKVCLHANVICFATLDGW